METCAIGIVLSIVMLGENNLNMNFWQRLKLGVKKLGPTGKVLFYGAIIAPVISILGLFLVKSCAVNIGNREIDKSSNVNQTMINSPNSIQISGGINVNANSPSRELTNRSKTQLLNIINQYPEKEIEIKTILGDDEAITYATAIREFLKSEGHEVVNFERVIFKEPIKGQTIYPEGERIRIIIGSK